MKSKITEWSLSMADEDQQLAYFFVKKPGNLCITGDGEIRGT